MNNTIHVKVHTPEGVYLEIDCLEVSSRNILGEFNILPFHTNYITNINDNLKITTTEGTLNEIPIQMGVLRFEENKMEVYLVLSPLLAPTDR